MARKKTTGEARTPNYWIVGASWGGSDHQDQRFVKNSIWMLGYDEETDIAQHKRATSIEVGDRIAIKRMKGQGATKIQIRHIGIVKGIVDDTRNVVCSVDWVATGLRRDVDSRGAFASIHGPYKMESEEDKNWLKEVFCL